MRVFTVVGSSSVFHNCSTETENARIKALYSVGVICVFGVSPGLSFGIDRAKWNIGLLSTSVMVSERNTLKGLLCRLFLALLFSGVKVFSTSIYRSSPNTVVLMPKVTQVSLKKLQVQMYLN